MKNVAAYALLAGAAAIFHTPVSAQPVPGEVRELLADATLAGSGRLTVWGFEVYDATLWVGSGFRASAFGKHPLVLELQYLREFKGSAIAERSIAEMRRVGNFTAEQAQRWQAAMTRLFPDVVRGDRIAGVYRPGEAVRFLHNGKVAGEVADAEFAELFIGIWLSPRTSEPKVRQALLAKAAP